jgi:hypothetical protein
MSANVPQNQDEQEIDLSQISKKIGEFFEGVSRLIFQGILLIKKNISKLLILLFIGFGLGFYLDQIINRYDSQIIVAPNFGSNDYLYSKIELLNSKIKENDTVFLKELGFVNSKNIKGITIEPILDVYKFANRNPENFELLKLLAENGDLNQIVRDNLTSKNYPFHALNISTSKVITTEGLINPLLTYLNASEYYSKIKVEKLKIIENKIRENDSIIKQIDGFLSVARNNTKEKSNNLVYYNENLQLNDIIKTKDDLIKEKGERRMETIDFDRVIKDVSIVTNIKNAKFINGKLKLVLPIVLIFLYIISSIFSRFYKSQYAKLNEVME